jgi:hypothetical protein
MKLPISRLLWLALAVGFTPAAHSAQVTFEVNMSVQSALGNFDPTADSVFVAGDLINSWSTSNSPLAASATDTNLWVGTFDVEGTNASPVQYKFLMTSSVGITTWEGNVGAGGTTGNRTFSLATTNQTLPAVYFNNVTNATTVTANVTFQVNMGVQVSLGNFDTNSGTVAVAGEFNSWNTTALMLTNSPGDPNVWVGSTKVSGALNSAVQYKFVMNGATWEGNVGPNGAQNRSLTLKNGDDVLPISYFNNLAAVPAIIPLTFQVNLSAQVAQGSFDPATGTVSVAGDAINNWDTAASPLSKSATNSNVWTTTLDITNATGGIVLYKFVLNGSTWETGDNRSYTLSSTNAQIVPLGYFNNASDLGPLFISSPAAGQITLSWTNGPLIRLQSAAGLVKPSWQDVPNTQGQSSAKVPVGAGPSFFRLIGP